MGDSVREQKARGIISSKVKQIEVILGGDKAKTSVFATTLLNIASDKNLEDCTEESILNVGMQIIQAGLHPNKLFGQAYVVPYGNVAQLQIGYKGWISLGYRNGWRFKAVAVYKCDDFKYEFGGFEDKINFKPNFDDREDDDGAWVYKNLIGVVVYAKDSSDSIWTEFVSFKKLEKLRSKSQTQKKSEKPSGTWLEWAEEMYKAKAIKYVITRLPINDRLMEAIVAEDEPFKEVPAKEEAQSVNLNVVDAEVVKSGDILHNELIKKGLSEEDADKITSRYSLEQIEQILADPSSIDAIIEQNL